MSTPPGPTPPRASLAQGFAAIGHFYIHFFTSIYFVIVLALEKEWGQSYGELIGLWTVGAALVGLGALPAGWLSDRWSARGMMALFFVGIGAAAIFCGFTHGPFWLAVLTGLAMLWAMRTGRLIEGNQAGHKGRPPTKGEMVRGVAILMLAMFLSGIIYQATQAVLPKQFELRFADWLQGSTLGVGAMIAIVYGVAGLIQYFGGHVADRYNLKYVYAGAFLIQVPLLAAISAVMGIPLLITATLAVVLSVGLLPAENMMLTRFTPERHRGLAFGMKYVISFGTAPLGLLLVKLVVEGTDGLDRLWLILAGAAAVIFIAALALPRDAREVRGAPAPAE